MKYLLSFVLICCCFDLSAQSLQLYDYGIQKSKQKVVLYWAYACDIEASYFVVEKTHNPSSDSTVYIGRVEPVCGIGLTHYSMVDSQTSKGISYYRVKAFNGLKNEFSYAYWQQVAFPLSEDSFFSIYPNPITDKNRLYFNWENTKTEEVYVEVLDLQGRKITELVNDEFPQGIFQKEYDTSNLRSGIYMLNGRVGTQSFQQRWIKP